MLYLREKNSNTSKHNKVFLTTVAINIETHAMTIKTMYTKIKLEFHIAYLDFVFVVIGVISTEFELQEFD